MFLGGGFVGDVHNVHGHPVGPLLEAHVAHGWGSVQRGGWPGLWTPVTKKS